MRFFGALWARRAIFRELACSALCALAPGFRDFRCVLGPGMGVWDFFCPALRRRDLGAIACGVGRGGFWGWWCRGAHGASVGLVGPGPGFAGFGSRAVARCLGGSGRWGAG